MSSDSSSIQDSNLEAFIALVLSDNQLKSEIKSALNQDQVIAIAASRGINLTPQLYSENGVSILTSLVIRGWVGLMIKSLITNI